MKPRFAHTCLLLLPLALAACVTPRATAGMIQVDMQVDGEQQELALPAGSTVQQAIDQAGIELGQLDLVDPPGYAVLTDGASVRITRRSERFEIEQLLLPFARQTVENESLPAGETRLLQPGQNGLEEITYRIVEEQGLEVSRQPVKRTVVQEPKPEIIMIGAQAVHTPTSVEGTLAYISAGNAWVMRGNSINRRPLVVTGDLDGQVFQLSPDGAWLLYSRRLEDEGDDFNGLWVISTEQEGPEPVDLQAHNVVHFAAWSPEAETNSLAYSTVEPRPSPPGWQANNDLILAQLSNGRVTTTELLAPNAGGQYGWWGTSFAWAPDGVHIAYAQADRIGVIDLRDPSFEPLHVVTPYETQGDWAWVPGLAWGHNSRTIFVVDHAMPPGAEDPLSSPIFDLIALGIPGAEPLPLVARAGMFAYPSLSPPRLQPSGEVASQLAFLQALNALDSQASAYRLMVMDRDGSNLQAVFPAAGEPGIAGEDLAPAVWSPGGSQIAVVYRGDLWMIDLISGAARPLTGDGQTQAIDWKP